MFGWLWSISPAWWLAAALFGGAALVVFGWRGRRIGDEPRCRRCRYILSDLPSAICPECGLDSAKRRPRRGVRRVRPIALGLGLVLLLAAAIPGQAILKNLDWRDYAPNWALRIAVDYDDRLAANRLSRRIRETPGLALFEIRATVERSLRAQQFAALDSVRLALWLDLLAQMDSAGLLTDEEWERMIQHSIRKVTVRMREACRVGDALPIEAEFVQVLPHSSRLSWSAQLFEAGSAEARPLSEPTALIVDTSWGTRTNPVVAAVGMAKLRHRGAPGLINAELKVTARYKAYDPFSSSFYSSVRRSARPSRRGDVGRVLARWDGADDGGSIATPENQDRRKTLAESEPPLVTSATRLPLEILPRSSDDDLRAVEGAAARDQFLEAVDVRLGPRGELYNWLGVRLRSRYPRVELRKELPFALAFTVDVVIGDHAKRVGEIACAPGTERALWPLPLAGYEDTRGADAFLVFTPSSDIARSSVYLSYLNETFRFGPFRFIDDE